MTWLGWIAFLWLMAVALTAHLDVARVYLRRSQPVSAWLQLALWLAASAGSTWLVLR
jgi:hypothetical protein